MPEVVDKLQLIFLHSEQCLHYSTVLYETTIKGKSVLLLFLLNYFVKPAKFQDRDTLYIVTHNHGNSRKAHTKNSVTLYIVPLPSIIITCILFVYNVPNIAFTLLLMFIFKSEHTK